MALPDSRPRLTAVLGPTNTGKTHLAIERMLGHASGMIGFPLRLLARENYDRVVRLKGARKVALVTGEERIVPAHAKYFLCTVESMPRDRPVDFLAVDEVQLAADPERGHVFTDRLLHARGREETMLIGADTVRPLLRRLVPEIQVIARPRLSVLSHAGTRKLTRLAPRSAVVAFSAEEVYAIAELLRRRHGGAAVVMGALSPRTRNAQVGMYQAGEVDYLVATDAIGMGLNMDLRHVTFSSLTKFDGRGVRPLIPAELAQIAGRAGRYLQDGSFGTSADAGPLDAEDVEAIEEHRFAPLRHLVWRTAELDFGSPKALLDSLDTPPPAAALRRVEGAEDRAALAALAARPEIASSSGRPADVRLLWEVAQIPDYRKLLSDAHVGLLAGIYRRLAGHDGHLPEDWTAREVDRIDRTDGDIPTLTQRIAHIRTWTYISHRADWLADPAHWQERTRAIEDRLSDALHDRLTQRFVDHRAARLMRRRGDRDALVGAVTRAGEVLIEGQPVGRLSGFRFIAEADLADALRVAARRAFGAEIDTRVARLEASADKAFALAPDGRIAWDGQPVARLAPGPTARAPRVRPLPSDLLEPAARERIRRRLEGWLAGTLAHALEPLSAALAAPLKGPARGLVYQLAESLGTVPRESVHATVLALGKADRTRLRRLGVRLGAVSVFVPALLAPPPVALRALLWATHHDFGDVPPTPAKGAASVLLDPALPAAFYLAIGYPPAGDRAVRADHLERLADAARRRARQGPFVATPDLARLVGCEPAELGPVLGALGYRLSGADGTAAFEWAPQRHPPPRRSTRPKAVADSPFAKLRELDLAL